MTNDRQVSALCRPCRQRVATYDFVGDEVPSGRGTVRRIRCCGCGNETWFIKSKPFRCYFGRTFYPDGSIGPREPAEEPA
jgi:hypothetical protein